MKQFKQSYCSEKKKQVFQNSSKVIYSTKFRYLKKNLEDINL